MSEQVNQNAENGKLGGEARAAALSSAERKASASTAAKARWLKAEHVGTLPIAGLEVQCAVLADGTRVLTQWDFFRAIGRNGRPAGGRGGSARVEEVASFLSIDKLKPFVSDDLAASTRPIAFSMPGGQKAHGYRAELLPRVCEVYLQAREKGALRDDQLKFARACELVMRGLAQVGIVALIDEATGYQEVRTRDALSKILEAFIAKELQAWVSTFPHDYYKEMFRLRGLNYPGATLKRPQYFGHLTNDLIYKRIAPGVLDELKRVSVRDEDGRLKHRYFQKLTSNTGYPKLKEHLGSVVTAMKLSDGWADFMQKMDRLHPRYGSTIEMGLEDGGTGL